MKSKTSLVTLLIIIFIDMIGVGIIIPILPLVFFEASILPEATSHVMRTFLLGLLLASYPLAQFIGAPMLGVLSDKHGRKNILIISLLGSAIGYALFAYGIIIGNIYILFFSRLLDGFTGGNISVARAAIADISTKENKVKNFGLIGMVFGVGFIVGPFVGGKLTDASFVSWFTYTTPFWAAMLLVTLNIIFILLVFEETLKERIQKKITLFTGFLDIREGFANKTLRPLFITSFFVFFGWSFFTMFFQIFLYDTFTFTPAQIGTYFAYIGLWIAIAQGIIIRPISTKVTPEKLVMWSLFAVPVVLLFYLVATKTYMLYLIVPFLAVSFGFITPNLSTLLSNAVSESKQGEVLGTQQSMLSLANVFPAVLGGISLALNVHLPIMLAAVTILGTAVYFAVACQKE